MPIPEALLVIYAGGWVIALTMNGLYRPRARWSILREAMDVAPRDDRSWRSSR